MATLYNTGNLAVSVDTFIRNSEAGTSHGSHDYIVNGQNVGWNQNDFGLYRFNGMPISTAGGTLVPVSAYLYLTTYTLSYSENGVLTCGRMNGAFTISSTWNSANSARASAVDTGLVYNRGSVGTQIALNISNTYKAIVSSGVNNGFWLGNSYAGAYRIASSRDNLTGPLLNCQYYISRKYNTVAANSYVSVSSNKTVYDGDTVSLSASLNNAPGYTTVFNGWYKDNVTLVSTSLNYSFAGSLATQGTYYARASRTANTYTITFNRNGAVNGTASTNATFGSVLPPITVPTKTGYKFTGYYNGPIQYYNVSGSGVRTYDINANTTFNAGWALNSHAVTLSIGTEILSTSGAGTFNYGAVVNANCSLKSYTGYTVTFEQWTSSNTSLLANSTNKAYSFTMPDGAVTLTASATKTANTYMVTYNGNGNTGGSTANSSHVYSVNKALTTNGFTKTGHTFAGWAYSSAGAVVYTNGQSVINLASIQGSTFHLYAKWIANTYTVTFNASPGALVGSATKSVTYNSSIGTLPQATRTGFDFDAWYTQAAGAGLKISPSTIYNKTANTTYYANFIGSGRIWIKTGPNKYKGSVTFYHDASTGELWEREPE